MLTHRAASPAIGALRSIGIVAHGVVRARQERGTEKAGAPTIGTRALLSIPDTGKGRGVLSPFVEGLAGVARFVIIPILNGRILQKWERA